ncbi:MAG: RrF2 family transcriptional regulator [Bdellovibrionia bacterium]
MIRLNKTTEYGLMALRHMSRKRLQAQSGSSELWTSAREIADSYGLPFEITAKTLQRLKEAGLIQSAHGAKGGYLLQRPLSEITLAEFLELMEGPQSVVACSVAGGPAASECEYGIRCEIKVLMNDLNLRLVNFLSGIRLADLAQGTEVQSVHRSQLEPRFEKTQKEDVK